MGCCLNRYINWMISILLRAMIDKLNEGSDALDDWYTDWKIEGLIEK